MDNMILSIIISLFTIFLYTALGTYVLTKNPHERTNKIFAILMVVFIIWSIGTYNIGIEAKTASLKEVVLYIKIQLSGMILALTVLVFFALSFLKAEKILKNPFTYLIILPSIYLLYIIWFSDVSKIELDIFSMIPEAKKELFLFSMVFAVAGIYLLLRYYTRSKYREREQAKLILAGAIMAILTAITANIILPMFFNIYILQLSTIAPAVMGIFFAYAVYQYGLFIRPMPEISATSFCGADCTICPEYMNQECRGCRFDRERYENCEIFRCADEKGYKDCGDCLEIITCVKRNEKHKLCFKSKSIYELEQGHTYATDRTDSGYEIFMDAVNCGSLGLIATTTPPSQVKEKYSLRSTPVLWISEEATEMGVKPDKIARLSIMLMNFMKKANKSIVLLDGVDELIAINGPEKVKNFIQILGSTAITTGGSIIISNLESENQRMLNLSIESITLNNSGKLNNK